MGSGRKFRKGTQPERVHKSGAGPNIYKGDRTISDSIEDVNLEIPIVQLDTNILKKARTGEIVILINSEDVIVVMLRKERLGIVSPAYEDFVRSNEVNSGSITSVSTNPNAAAFRPIQ